MATLDELLKIDGVAAAGEFRLDGSLVDYKANMEMPSDMAAMSAQFCSSVTHLFNTLGGAFSAAESHELGASARRDVRRRRLDRGRRRHEGRLRPNREGRLQQALRGTRWQVGARQGGA